MKTAARFKLMLTSAVESKAMATLHLAMTDQ